MKTTTRLLAAVLLAACAIAGDRPVITWPENGDRIGEAKDAECPPPDHPCFRIEAEGRVPRNTHAFFAVEPMEVSPRMWIQPRIHSSRNGSVRGTVYLGERDNGAGQTFQIYLLACGDDDALRSGETILRIPKGCVASTPVKVERLR